MFDAINDQLHISVVSTNYQEKLLKPTYVGHTQYIYIYMHFLSKNIDMYLI